MYVNTVKISAKTEACSGLAAKYGAEDSTQSKLVSQGIFIQLLLHLSMMILQLQRALCAEEQLRELLSFCLGSFHPEPTDTGCLSGYP